MIPFKEIDIASTVVYFLSMFHFVKVIAIVFAIVAMVAPIGATSDCHDSIEIACATDCSCVCCSITAFDCHEKASVAISPIARRIVISDPQWSEILLVADVFRPPISI